MEDKRRFVRLDATCSVSCSVMAHLHKPYATLSKDISGGGLKIETEERFKLGTVLEMEINIKDKPPIFAIGKVVWLKDAGSGQKFEAGIQFLNIEPSDREAIIALTSSDG